jgi:nicotinamidase-related amidase
MTMAMKWIAALAAVVALGSSVTVGETARAQTVIEQWQEAKIPPPPPVKPVRTEAKKTALLLLDFNRGSCNLQRRVRCGEALPKLRKLLDLARNAGALVVFKTQASASSKDIPDEITPLSNEQVFTSDASRWLNVFHSQNIVKLLKDHGIENVILTGTSPNSTVQFAVGGASDAGFKAIVPVDGMPADTIYQEQFTVWNIGNGAVLRENSTLTKLDMIEFF